MTIFENYVLEKVNEGQSVIGLYPPTNEDILRDYEDWKAKQIMSS